MNSSASLWTAQEAASATGGKTIGKSEWHANGVSIDTRTLEPGDLFIALVGENNDGHDYLETAFKKGAAAALVANETDAANGSGPCILVPDTQAAMEALGSFARDRAMAKRIAVTGSVGKTGTKEMLRHVLSGQGRTHASAASYNNLWGVPLTLARMPADTQFGVFEIGMNHAGEITPLTAQVKPHTAIVTTVAPVHLEFFDSVAAIADAKAEIFSGLEQGGIAILNRDNEHFDRLRQVAERYGAIKTFGTATDADARLTLYQANPQYADVEADICGELVTFKLYLSGQHQALNALAVLAAVSSVGADVEQAARDLGDVRPFTGRGEVKEFRVGEARIIVIDESYNANPTSMSAAIESLGLQQPTGSGRRIAVLGDMLELGPEGPKLHASMAQAIERADIECVFLSGPLMANLWAELPDSRRGHYADASDKLIDPLISSLCDGDILMIKGSLGSKMGLIIKALSEKNELKPVEADTGRDSNSGFRRGRDIA